MNLFENPREKYSEKKDFGTPQIGDLCRCFSFSKKGVFQVLCFGHLHAFFDCFFFIIKKETLFF